MAMTCLHGGLLGISEAGNLHPPLSLLLMAIPFCMDMNVRLQSVAKSRAKSAQIPYRPPRKEAKKIPTRLITIPYNQNLPHRKNLPHRRSTARSEMRLRATYSTLFKHFGCCASDRSRDYQRLGTAQG